MLQRLISKSEKVRKAIGIAHLPRIITATLFAALIFSGIAAAVPTSTNAYTSPGKPSGFVNDFAGLISASQRAELEAKLRTLEGQTGTELSVVTIATLGGDTPENFANALFSEWGIGKKGKDNGVLLLVARDDREVRIEVGYGAEVIITDAFAGRVVRDILLPAFRTGDYFAGISGAVDKISAALSDPAAAEVWAKSNGAGKEDFAGVPWQGWIIISIFALVFLARGFASFAQSKSWWQGGVLGFIFGFFFSQTLVIALGVGVIGLIVDFIASTFFFGKFKDAIKRHGGHGPWFFGGGSGGSHGGGFGGFGGGMSGGGGAGGRW